MTIQIRPVTVATDTGKFRQEVRVAGHVLHADEPASYGGDDTGPAPHEWVLAGLGACTSMTLKLYADRKQWPLERVSVELTAEHNAEGYNLRRKITLVGAALTEEHRTRLLEIANKCPVHKALSGPIRIESSLA
jgi:putative redox protein